MSPEITIARRVEIALRAYAMASMNCRHAKFVGAQAEVALWQSVMNNCLDEIDECTTAIRAEISPASPPRADEILKGNADIGPALAPESR